MNKTYIMTSIWTAWILAVLAFAPPVFSDVPQPIVSEEVVFEETDGFLTIEAEHFFKQTHTDKRAWYITSSKAAPQVQPDADPPHVAGASGGAYVEALPDTRRNEKEKLVNGENFSNTPGQMAILYYKAYFNTPGRYYVWVRTFSTGTEDNSIHVGLDGAWPEHGQRMQFGRTNQWKWDNRQRTEKVHTGVPLEIYLDIEKPGEHIIQFSMREDGFEFDKFIFTNRRDFKVPADAGPAPKVKSGKLPEPFPFVAAPPAPPEPSLVAGSNQPGAQGLTLMAADFPVAGTGYYLHQGKWLAINPEKNQSAKTRLPFPFPSGRYHVTLQAVGESDGKSAYEVRIGDRLVGNFTCPLSNAMYEEGPQFAFTWKNVDIKKDDIIEVQSKIASEDGKEFSRARWAWLAFAPADPATREAAKKAAPKSAPAALAPAKPTPIPAPLVPPRRPDGTAEVAVSGELKQWHKVTLTLDGPFAHERDNEPNPFTDYCMTVTFRHESGSPTYRVPGYFAADGNAANTSAESGTKWRAHLSPDKSGRWTYTVSFVKGKHAAIGGASGEPLKPFDGVKGEFTVAPTDKTGRDFRAKGRLQYVGGHYLRFAGTGEYFLKAGPDSPENLLGYADFDGTYPYKQRGKARPGEASPAGLKTYEPHVGDWRPGDPTWKDGKGKGLIGALNYLASKGVNSFSFLSYNAGGDGDDVWPFVERNDKFHYDCSKLDQWGIVFDHGTALGLHLHFKLQEQEMDDNRRGEKGEGSVVQESLDGGKLGPERKLYLRELIARYAHNLALNWNLGEENTQSTEEQRDMAQFIHDTDPYHHNIVVHTFPPQQDKVYTPLLGKASALTGVSLQNGWNQVHQRTLKWVVESDKAGKPWVVANDEQGPADMGVPPDPGYRGHSGKAVQNDKEYDMHDIRKLTLWGNFMAGGAGVEYYFGYKLPENDLQCQDFRSRDKTWDYCRIALEFFRDHKIPFWEMKNADALVGNAANGNSRFCFAKAGEIYLVYLPTGGTAELDLSGTTGNFRVEWFNPRTGGALLDGTVKQVAGGGKVSLGAPPKDANEDWLAVVRK